MYVLDERAPIDDTPEKAPEAIGSVARSETVRNGETVVCVALKVAPDRWDVINTSGPPYSIGNRHIEEGYWTIIYKPA